MADHERQGESSRSLQDSFTENESSFYAPIVQTDDDASPSRETFQRPRPGRGYGTTRSSLLTQIPPRPSLLKLTYGFQALYHSLPEEQI